MTDICSIICTDCNESIDEVDVFRWSCGHVYHTKCVKCRINESLSHNNSIPRCIYPDCNRSLTIHNKQQYNPSKIQAILPKKYKGGKNMFDYDKNECLIYGFIKQILYLNVNNNIIVPTEILLLIFDYYCLNYFKQIICFLCSGTGIPSTPKETKCTQCVNGTMFVKCRDCNGRGYTTSPLRYPIATTSYGYNYSRTTCEVCKGLGKHDCGKCPSCKGHCIIREKSQYCFKCHGKKYLISIDFNKLCRKQALCLGCSSYFPMDKITYWKRCHHTYCASCVSIDVQKQILKYENPHCPMKDCKFKEKLQCKWYKTKCKRYCWKRCNCEKYYFKTYYETNTVHYCGNVNDDYGVLVWPGCKHVFCKRCITLDIRDDLIKLKMAKCPLTMFHRQHENLISMKLLRSLQSHFIGKSDNFNFNYYFKRLKSLYVYCKICEERHHRDEVFLWSKCGHKYGIKCMKKYFDVKHRRVVMNNDILFCIENNIKRKVVCFNGKCNETLTVADYKENNFGRIYETKK